MQKIMHHEVCRSFFHLTHFSSTECIFPADSQAKDKADIITPAITASARLSVRTVMTATAYTNNNIW